MSLLDFIKKNDNEDKAIFIKILNLYLGLKVGGKDLTVQGLKKEIRSLTK